MRVIGPSSEEEMVALFLRGELTSERFGPGIREALRAEGAGSAVIERPSTTTTGSLRAGRRFPEPILVTAGADAPVVVLEGHVRVTAYALARIAIGEALLGTSPGMRLWALY